MDSVSKAKVKPSAKAKAHSQNSLKRIKKKNLARDLVTNGKNGSSHTSNPCPTPPVPEKRSDPRGQHHQLQQRGTSREKETDPETEEEIYQSRKLMIRQIQVSCQVKLLKIGSR